MRAAEFEQRYQQDADPWGYRSSPYEHAKYDATLEVCGVGPFRAALELGGSIGVFSARVAPRCLELTTVDFSPTAVGSARHELRPFPHVRALVGEIPDALPDGSYDLVVASEILYYLKTAALAATLSRLEQALAPGGRVVAVHWRPAGSRAATVGRRGSRRAPGAAMAAHRRGPFDAGLPAARAGAMTEPYGLLIVGGGPAGLAAARAYRETVGDGRVAIVTDEYRLPYSRPPLTKELLRGESSEQELPIENEAWLELHKVELIGGRVVALDHAERTASLSGGRELGYVHCVLATGAEPTRLPVPGSDHPRVHVLRTLDHLRELQARLHCAPRVTVIGSGFIGCEIAGSLRMRGHEVDLVSDEPAPNAARLGARPAEIIRGWLQSDGVRMHLGTPVDRLEAASACLTVVAGEHRIVADVVVMAVGVSPRSELAGVAGLELDDGAIPVDASMRTRQAGLLAAGDVCKAENLAAGRPLRVEHWGDALAQGEIAGRTAAGAGAAWDAVPGFWSTIGRRTLKYAAWGDGYEESRLERHGDGGFTAWYGSSGKLVGVLTHEADNDYDRGAARIAEGAPCSS